MSENIPESIPTSYDPRSRRPAKKRALSPRSETASQISSLFSKPEKALLDVPSQSLTSAKPNHHAPPEIVQNVQGSSAGAGSGEFHVYKASRRREYERLRSMEEEVEREEGDRKWEKERDEKRRADEEKTRRKREKRERSKGKKGKGGGSGGKDDDEVDVEGAGKGGKIKPRVHVREGLEGLGGEGAADDGGESAKAVEEIGVIIHDDD